MTTSSSSRRHTVADLHCQRRLRSFQAPTQAAGCSLADSLQCQEGGSFRLHSTDSLMELRLPSPQALRLALGAAACTGAALLSVCLVRAVLAGRAQPPAADCSPAVASALQASMPSISAHFWGIKEELAQRLSAALQLRTVSFEDKDGTPASLLGTAGLPAAPAGGCACCSSLAAAEEAPAQRDGRTAPSPAALEESRSAFLAFHALLEASFPRLHASLERHVINTYSLLYVWRPAPGSAPALPGFALAAHMDVVPVPDAAEWRHPPFAGTLAGGYVWGRGAIDDKHSLLSICEAVEHLLSSGFQPACPILLAFGHDEELGGSEGAAAIAAAIPALLCSREEQAAVARPAAAAAAAAPPLLSFLLDEGLFLLSGLVPGMPARCAVVCVGEKGHLNVELCAEGQGGHSSVPPSSSSSIGILAKAVAAVEAVQQPVRLQPALGLFTALLPALPLFPSRFFLANAWLVGPLLKAQLLASPATAAMLRTSTAVTLISGGLKSNCMPPRATAIVNHRIHPADSVASVLARDAAACAGLPGLSLRALEPLEPSPVSDASAPAFGIIASAVAAAFEQQKGSIITAPGLMLGNTDTKHFWGLAANIYRHCPTELSMAETALFHGRDERVSIDNLARLCAFYAAVILGGSAQAAATASAGGRAQKS
jgi:carboxypeptidase PM20D1